MFRNVVNLLAIAITSFGCGYAELAKYSDDVVGAPPSILNSSKNQNTIRVVVRYAAVQDEASFFRVERATQRYHEWDRVACAVKDHSSLVLSKSAYYAARFSQLLRDEFPGAYVVTQPMLIDVDSGGQARWISGEQDDLIPTVLVDFLAYVDQCRPITHIGSTSGRIVNPHLTIRVPSIYSTNTNGLVASTIAFLHVTGKRDQPHKSAYYSDGATIVDVLNLPSWRESDLFLFDQPTLWEQQKITSRPWLPDRALLVRDSRIELIPSQSDGPDPLTFSASQLSFWINVIGDAAQVVSGRPNAMLESYATLIDAPSTASLEQSAEYMKMLRAAYSMESKFLEHISVRLEDTTVSGEFGSNFRSIREQEEDGKSFASQMSMILSASAIAHAQGASNSYQGALIASEEMNRQQADNAAVVSSAALPQVVISGEFLGQSQKISASSLSELRFKLSRIFKDKTLEIN